MESIYVSQKDMLEICQDGDKYFLRYPTFNITCPEVVREIPKEAADSYMSGEHTGKELMNYAQYGFWKSKKQYTQEESNKIFIRNNPDLIFNDLPDNKKIFSSPILYLAPDPNSSANLMFAFFMLFFLITISTELTCSELRYDIFFSLFPYFLKVRSIPST